MIFEIPGRETLEINHIIFDFNGTIAIDGNIIDGVKDKINALAKVINFHVVTADTYGTAAKKLAGVDCQLINLSTSNEFNSKTDYLHYLGAEQTLSVGNGFNDKALLKQSRLGIALIQAEGLCVETMMAADIVCHSVLDVFSYIEQPNRLRATLRE